MTNAVTPFVVVTFPPAPVVGDIYVASNGASYTWDGEVWAGVPGTAVDVDYGIGLALDETQVPQVVNLTPAGSYPQFLGGVYVPPRSNVHAGDVSSDPARPGELLVPLATDLLAGSIVEPPPDGLLYVRSRDLTGISAWVPNAAGADFGTGLTLDETAVPPIVHLQPAGAYPQFLGGVYVPPRSDTQALIVSDPNVGELLAPPATDLLLGGLLEPPPDGLAYSRQWDNITDPANPKWIWTPAVTAGLQITGLIPNKAILGEPIVTVHAYGSEFTPTCVCVVDGTDTATTYISATELTFFMNPAVPIAPSVHIITVRDTATGEVGLGAEQFEFIVASTSVDYGTGLSLDTAPTPPIVHLQPAGWAPQFLGGVYTNGGRSGINGLDLAAAGTGELSVPLATDLLAGSITEPPPDDKGYVRRRDLAGNSAWVPPADTPLPDFGTGLMLDETQTPQIVHLQVAGSYPQFLGGVYVPPVAESNLIIEADGRLTAAAQITDYGTGLSYDETAVPPIVHLQPAGDSPATLGGVYVVDRVRNVSEGLELGADGQLRAPLATPRLAGTIVEPEDDGKGYVRTTLNGVSAWVPPADTPLPDFGIGLSLDETQTPQIVNLTPAGWAPQFLGGVYGSERTATQGLDLAAAGTGEISVPLATDLLAGSIVEPPPDDRGYVRRRDLNGVSAWVPPADTPLPDFGIGLSLDETQTPQIVHLTPAGWAPQFLGGVYGSARTATQGLELSAAGTGEISVPLATDQLAGAITEPPPDDRGYVRRRDLAGNSAWVPPADTPLPDFGVGLSLDETATPQVVNLTPAGIAPQFLGGVYVPPRSDTQGLIVSDPNVGELLAPPATDLLLGGVTEPTPDGIAYSRQWDVTLAKWIWTPAVTAGLQITGLIPNKAILGEPIVTVHVIGAEFTSTCVITVDGTDTATTYISATELTFFMNPAVPIDVSTHIIMVRDTATGEVGLGAEQFEFIKATTEVDYGLGLSFDTTPTPPMVNLQPAGIAPELLGGVYVPVRSATQGLIVSDPNVGELLAPLATDQLAGTILEPPPDDRGYVRRRDLAGNSAWVPPADTPLPDFGIGLSLDETASPQMVNLTPAGWAPQFLGGVYGSARTATQGLDLSAAGTGEISVPLATDLLAGSIVEPPPDGLFYARTRDIAGVSTWTPSTSLVPIAPTPPTVPAPLPGQLYWRNDPDGELYIYYDDGTSQQWVPASKPGGVGADFGIGLALDETQSPPIVHLTPAGDAPQFLGGVYVIDRARNVSEGLELGIDGRLRAPLATPRLAGTIVEPEDDGRGYVRTTLNGVSMWVPPADTQYYFVLGLSFDETTRDVNLTPAGWAPEFLGGVYGSARSATNGLDLAAAGTGEISVPLATDLLAGAIIEPPPDGLQYARSRDLTGVSSWLPAASLVTIGATPPVMPAPQPGQLFWRNDPDGELYIYYDDGTSQQWVPASKPGGGGASVSIGDAPPLTATPGDLWWESDTGTMYVYYDDGTSMQWVQIDSAEEAGSAVTISDTPPASPAHEDMWWNSTTAALFIYYDDGTSAQWVQVDSSGGAASAVTISDTAPANPVHEDLWWNSTTGIMFIYYDDGTSAQWVAVDASAGGSSTASITISDTAPPTPIAGALWFNSTNGCTFIWYEDVDSAQWVMQASPSVDGGGTGGITEAPIDGTPYQRQDAAWISAAAGSGITQADADLRYLQLTAPAIAPVTGVLTVSAEHPNFALRAATSQGFPTINIYGDTGLQPYWSMTFNDTAYDGDAHFGRSPGNPPTMGSLVDWLTVSRATGVADFASTPTRSGTPLVLKTEHDAALAKIAALETRLAALERRAR